MESGRRRRTNGRESQRNDTHASPHLLLGVNQALPLLPTKTHHLVTPLAVGLVAHALDLRLYARLPEASRVSGHTPRYGEHAWDERTRFDSIRTETKRLSITVGYQGGRLCNWQEDNGRTEPVSDASKAETFEQQKRTINPRESSTSRIQKHFLDAEALRCR